MKNKELIWIQKVVRFEKGNLEKEVLYTVRLELNQVNLIYQIKITNSNMGQDLVPLLREQSFLGILLLLMDCMSYEFLCLCMLSRFSCVQLVATSWTGAHEAPLSVGFSRQEYQSGLPFPSPGDFPNPGIEPRSPTLQADSLPSEPPGKLIYTYIHMYNKFLALYIITWM